MLGPRLYMTGRIDAVRLNLSALGDTCNGYVCVDSIQWGIPAFKLM